MGGMQAKKEEEKYEDWKPNLGAGARNMITQRGLALAEGDLCFAAIQHLWMNDLGEATNCLLDVGKSGDDVFTPDSSTVAQGNSDFGTQNQWGAKLFSHKDGFAVVSEVDRVITYINTQINFSTCPFLLKMLKTQKRIQWCSTLLVARALTRRGIELSSMKALLDDPEDEEDSDSEVENSGGTVQNGQTNRSCSIFDSFDVPSSKPKQSPAAGSGGMNSSIFDDFGAPPPKPKQTTAEPSGEMSSSIFDDFGVPPPKPKPKPAPASGEMNSSIFDDFGAPPPKPKPKAIAAPSSGEMNSSIFDDFGAPPPKPKPKPVAAPSSGEMNSSIFDDFSAPPPKPKPKPVVASASGEMNSSIFDDFGGPPPKPKLQPTAADSQPTAPEEVATPEPIVAPLKPLPPLWKEMRQNLLILSAARRLLREMTRIITLFQGDPTTPPLKQWRSHDHPLVPDGSAEILHDHCEEGIFSTVYECLEHLCSTCNLDPHMIVKQALIILGSTSQPRRVIFEVLLRLLIDRSDLAEDVLSDSCQGQMQRCDALALSNDDLIYKRKTRSHVSSQLLRRHSAAVSWQLELCLWLHRGGNLPLSYSAVKEAIVAARVGLLVSAWARCFETVNSLFSDEPDCLMDADCGRQLWTSFKVMNSPMEKERKNTGRSSGGWEFLVDCKRKEATEMLRDRKPGIFLLRPHADDHGVFTLSFKTNLVVSPNTAKNGNKPSGDAKPVSRDDLVQHAIIRLSDVGFRCGAFGPCNSLMELLEAVSRSLPFDLLFNEPPVDGIIKDQGEQPSPNSCLIRKLDIKSHRYHFTWNDSNDMAVVGIEHGEQKGTNNDAFVDIDSMKEEDKVEMYTRKRFGIFTQLLGLTEVTKLLCCVAAAENEDHNPPKAANDNASFEVDIDSSTGSACDSTESEDDVYTVSSRMLRPLLEWRRTLEVQLVPELAPCLTDVAQTIAKLPVAVTATETAIEATPSGSGVAASSCVTGGDSLIKRMIKPGSGVEFRTLRVGKEGRSAMIILFSKNEAIPWIIHSGTEDDEVDAEAKLKWMEKRRVIEEVDLDNLTGASATGGRDHIRYRFVDPWEVEALENREAERSGATLGRQSYVAFSVATVAASCEKIQRSIGGLQLLSLWSKAKGGIFITKAIASVLPPWERDAGADLQMRSGDVVEPSLYVNSIREHLYRNLIYRRLRMPQRFLSLVQVELLDLKNLTSPSGAMTLKAYALLRLKRPSSNAPLTHKSRPLDSAATEPKKIGKCSGPNAPSSWGTLVRFRFPLPEDVNCDGVSFDRDCEYLHKGPPSVLQINVYEQGTLGSLMKDHSLGGADIKLDALGGGGQLEEWVPLRAGKSGITWFARIRISLRFELMCLDTEEVDQSNKSTRRSVGLKKIIKLSQLGGAHEDSKGLPNSVSTPDLFSYLESLTIT